MGLKYRAYLEGTSSIIYGCSKCQTHLSTSDSIISRQFQGQHGQAFLFEDVVNVKYGKAEDREMTTGLHRVKDVSCVHCSVLLGWHYVKAYNSDNKYKEGKYVLEKKLLVDLSPRIHISTNDNMVTITRNSTSMSSRTNSSNSSSGSGSSSSNSGLNRRRDFI